MPSALRNRAEEVGFADLSPRIGSRIYMEYRGRYVGRSTPQEFIWSVERAFGSSFHHWLCRSTLALRIVGSYLK